MLGREIYVFPEKNCILSEKRSRLPGVKYRALSATALWIPHRRRELECSKQNIDDLVKRGKLHSVKEGQRYRLFMKSEVEERRWK